MFELKNSVNLVEEFMNFESTFNYIQLFVYFSFIYVAATIWIVFRMYRTYHYEYKVFHRGSVIHKSLFQSFIWMELANLSFFLLDNLTFRIPSTGLVTSLCASIPPSHFLKVLYMLQLATNYFSMLYSLLFCLTRFVIVHHTSRECYSLCRRMFVVFVPFTVALPLCADFYLLPALGFCRQLSFPYPYGAVSVSFTETWLEIRTDKLLLYMNFICPVIIMLINGVLMYKVRMYLFQKDHVNSRRASRAQWSLTLTTLAIMGQFLVMGSKTVVSTAFPEFGTYALLVRNPLVDFTLVLVPWIFYLSHPMFHEKSTSVPSIT